MPAAGYGTSAGGVAVRVYIHGAWQAVGSANRERPRPARVGGACAKSLPAAAEVGVVIPTAGHVQKIDHRHRLLYW